MVSSGWDEFVLNRVDLLFGGVKWLVSLGRYYKRQDLYSRRSLCVYEES